MFQSFIDSEHGIMASECALLLALVSGMLALSALFANIDDAATQQLAVTETSQPFGASGR